MTREEALKSKLQKYSLKDLRIVGMWRTEGESRKALVLTPEGQGITVQENDPITPGGKVARIEKDKIIVRMYSMDLDGTQRTRDESLAFNKGHPAEDSGKIIQRPGQDAEYIADKKSLPERPAAALPSLNAAQPAPQPAAPMAPPATIPNINPPVMPVDLPVTTMDHSAPIEAIPSTMRQPVVPPSATPNVMLPPPL